MAISQTTTDHEAIWQWAEERGGRPARVKDTGDGGILRIDFAEPDESLEELAWDDLFEVFEDHKLAVLYQEKTVDGETSRFNKFVDR